MVGVRLSTALLWVASFFLNVALVSSQFVPNAFWVPVGIRSPYFNTWTLANNPENTWETFWNMQITAWMGHIRVDGVAYQWLGSWRLNPPLANFTAASITPTRTIFYMRAGQMNLTVTFMSPIEPEDPVKQSFPFSYLSLEASSLDGNSHNVQVYTDVSAEWLSGGRSEIVMWNTTQTSSSTYHTVQLQHPTPFVEVADQAEDVVLYYATANAATLSSRIDIDQNIRPEFDTNGTISGPPSVSSGPISNPFPVYAHMHDLGNIAQFSQPLVWSLGIVRNPTISYLTPTGQTQNRSAYFVSQYNSMSDAIDAFVGDFNSASSRADSIDQKILNAASNISSSSSFANLLSLAARQTIGSTDLTISMGSDGKWNTSDVKMFMKDVGTSRRVNPVENLYASLPFFLYMNSTYAGYLLNPLLEYQSSPQYQLPYAARDLGQNYSMATGNNASHSEGVEQSGNMLIMALAHARTSGDGSLIFLHYNLLKGWADYLVNNTLTPTQQVNADAESSANNTNLAIKGIIGIQAMSEISLVLGEQADSSHYAGVASSYYQTWQSLAMSSDSQHILANYGNQNSWALMYNLYADRLLQTKVVPNSIYQTLTQYYKSLISTSSATQYGIPIDSSSPDQANSAWTMFAASITTDSSVRDSLISPIWTHASSNTSGVPNSLIYKLDTGASVSGNASPGQGAMFAPLALTIANTTISVPTTILHSNHKSIVGPVVGGVVGGLAFIALILLAAFFWYRNRQSKYTGTTDVFEGPKLESNDNEFVGHQPEFNPYMSEQNASQIGPNGLVTMTAATPLLPPQTPAGITPMSSKAREAMMNSQPAILQPANGPGSQSAYSAYSAGSSRDPPSSVVGDSVSSDEVRGLRQEMENLRRAMQEIQVERLEAPPTYEAEV